MRITNDLTIELRAKPEQKRRGCGLKRERTKERADKADCPQGVESFLLPNIMPIVLHIFATGREVKVPKRMQASLEDSAQKLRRLRALTHFRTGPHQSAVHDNGRLQAMLQDAKKLLGFGSLASIRAGFHQDALGDSTRLQMLLNAEQEM